MLTTGQAIVENISTMKHVLPFSKSEHGSFTGRYVFHKVLEGRKNLKRILTGGGFLLISKVRVAPKLSEAMTGHLPSEGSSSLCQSTLSFSFRYKLQSKELKVWPVFSSIWSFSVRSTGCHCNREAKRKGRDGSRQTQGGSHR